MATYSVEIRETVVYTVEVAAKSKVEAREQAWVDFQGSSDPMNDFCGAPQGAKIVAIWPSSGAARESALIPPSAREV